jgi:hypothetical protein
MISLGNFAVMGVVMTIAPNVSVQVTLQMMYGI